MATCLPAPAPAQGSRRPAKHGPSSSAPAAAKDGTSRGAAHSTSSNVSPPAASAAPIRLLDLLLLGLRSCGHGCGRFSGLLLGLSSSDHWKAGFSQESSKQNCSK